MLRWFNKVAQSDLVSSILAAMRQVEPRADKGALISLRDTRRVVPVPKVVFDKTIIDMANSGLIYLHRHTLPKGWGKRVENDLVKYVAKDGTEEYFVGAALASAFQ